MLKFILILGLSVYLVVGAPQPEGEEYEDEYEEEDVCLTSADSEDPEKECIFPFTFNNFTYNGCPTDPVDETKRWCSTKTDENGVHITGDGTWGYCTQGCKPEIFPDELLIGTDAENDTQTETCDFTACNGFTFKLDVFDQVETYGQCQYPAGENGADDDYFCFVNADSACEDKVPYGDEEEGLFVTTLACKDPKAPLSRTFGSHRRSFSKGFVGSNRRHKSSSHGSSYGRGRYSSGGYKGSSFHRRSGYGSSSHGSSHKSSSNHGSSYSQKQTCKTVYKEQCTYEQKQECKQTYKTVTTYENKKQCETQYKSVTTYEQKKECETHYETKTTYENKKECKTVYKKIYKKERKCETTYIEECNHDNHGSSYGRRGKRDNYGNSGYHHQQIKCKKVPNENCKYVEVPRDVPETKCNYVKVPKHSRVPQQKCHYVKVPKHSKVPEQSCHYVKVPKQSRVPDQKCHYVKVPKCHKVPEKQCHTSSYKPRKRYGSSHSSHHSSHGSTYRG